MSLDLDSNREYVFSSRLVDDLSQVSSTLELNLVLNFDFTFDSSTIIRYLGRDWQVLGGSQAQTPSVNQLTLLCYPKGVNEKVLQPLSNSTQLLTKFGYTPGFYGFTSRKFQLPSLGDTYLLKMNQYLLLSYEENYKKLSRSLCLSATSQGLFCATWEELKKNQKALELSPNIRPETYLVNERDSSDALHTQILRPETLESYQKKLFGNKFVVHSNSRLELGKLYTMSLSGLGWSKLTPMILMRQEHSVSSDPSVIPMKQVFVEVQDGNSYI